MGSLKRKESLLERDKISDISNKMKQNYFNSIDMDMYTSTKNNKGHLPMYKTQSTRKSQADLDLITSCFENG